MCAECDQWDRASETGRISFAELILEGIERGYRIGLPPDKILHMVETNCRKAVKPQK